MTYLDLKPLILIFLLTILVSICVFYLRLMFSKIEVQTEFTDFLDRQRARREREIDRLLRDYDERNQEFLHF